MQTTLAEANKVAEETISAMRTVRSFANENREAESYYAKLLVMFQLNKKQALAYACYMCSSSVGISSCLFKLRAYSLFMYINKICVCSPDLGARSRGVDPLLRRLPRH